MRSRRWSSGWASPGWQSLLILINASQRLMDGRFADATSLTEKALRVGARTAKQRTSMLSIRGKLRS